MRSALVLCLFVALAAPAFAADCQKPAAEKHLEAGKALVQKQKLPQAIAEFRAAIEADPACTEAHTQFILYTESSYLNASHFWQAANFEERRKRMDPAEAAARAHLRKVYAAWAKQYPKYEAVFDWAQGKLYPTQPAIARGYYQKALALDPRFGAAADALGSIAQAQGNDLLSRQYYSQAVRDDPKNGDYFFDYLMTFRNGDVAKYRELTEEFVRRFPTAGRAPQALNYLATVLDSDADKIQVLEQLRSMDRSQKLGGFGMDELFDAYARTDPAKAVALAENLTRNTAYPSFRPTYQSWLKYAQALAEIQSLVHGAKYADAIALARKTSVPQDRDSAPLIVLRAQAKYGGGQAAAAYDELVHAEAARPNPRVEAELRLCAAGLKKSTAETLDDVWRARDAAAKIVPDFQLTDYQTGKPVKLSAYRGKVVLLDFFFPT